MTSTRTYLIALTILAGAVLISGQYERTARADAAEVEKLTNTVIALRLLAANRD